MSLNSNNHTLPYNIFHSPSTAYSVVTLRRPLQETLDWSPLRLGGTFIDVGHLPDTNQMLRVTLGLCPHARIGPQRSWLVKTGKVGQTAATSRPFVRIRISRVLPLATKVLLSWYSDEQFPICVLHKRPPPRLPIFSVHTPNMTQTHKSRSS